MKPSKQRMFEQESASDEPMQFSITRKHFFKHNMIKHVWYKIKIYIITFELVSPLFGTKNIMRKNKTT